MKFPGENRVNRNSSDFCKFPFLFLPTKAMYFRNKMGDVIKKNWYLPIIWDEEHQMSLDNFPAL